jgi:hypothetical protein
VSTATDTGECDGSGLLKQPIQAAAASGSELNPIPADCHAVSG